DRPRHRPEGRKVRPARGGGSPASADRARPRASRRHGAAQARPRALRRAVPDVPLFGPKAGRPRMTAPRLLLLSNSTQHGRGYLDHAEEEIRELLDGARRVLFFPFALHDRRSYAEKTRRRFKEMGFELAAADEASAAENAEAFFVGGGNTFRLLTALQD